MEKYLPNGSIVLLKDGKKRIMIIGRGVREHDGDRSWDYIACPYPEGFTGENYAYLFNHEQIARTYFLGFQDQDEFRFHDRLLAVDESKTRVDRDTQAE